VPSACLRNHSEVKRDPSLLRQVGLREVSALIPVEAAEGSILELDRMKVSLPRLRLDPQGVGIPDGGKGEPEIDLAGLVVVLHIRMHLGRALPGVEAALSWNHHPQSGSTLKLESPSSHDLGDDLSYEPVIDLVEDTVTLTVSLAHAQVPAAPVSVSVPHLLELTHPEVVVVNIPLRHLMQISEGN